MLEFGRPTEIAPEQGVVQLREDKRLLQRASVRRYMEGASEHPGFLLPWEELREDGDGFYYYVDLVTGKVTYREEKKSGAKKQRLYDRPELVGFPPTLYFAPVAEKELYVRRRSLFVEYWRYYLSQRKLP